MQRGMLSWGGVTARRLGGGAAAATAAARLREGAAAILAVLVVKADTLAVAVHHDLPPRVAYLRVAVTTSYVVAWWPAVKASLLPQYSHRIRHLGPTTLPLRHAIGAACLV